MQEQRPNPPVDWTTPGAFEVATGVHRIPLPMPSDALRAVNVYVLDGDPGDGGCVLIDAGWALTEAQSALEAGLASIGYEIGDIRRILVTHAHRDHYTLGVTLQRTFGTRLAIGIGEQPNIEASVHETANMAASVLPLMGAAHLIRAWADVYSEEDRLHTAASFGPPDEWIDGGQKFDAGPRTLTAIETPGHTRGHLVFLDATASVLFTGDHVLPHITPSIGFQPARTRDPLGDYLRSLHLLLTNPDALMLPAHGPAGGSVHARVHELIAHHDQRLSATKDAVLAGAGTAFETARGLSWTRRHTAFDDLEVFNQILATGETFAHLIVLTDRGELQQQVAADGVWQFEPPRRPVGLDRK